MNITGKFISKFISRKNYYPLLLALVLFVAATVRAEDNTVPGEEPTSQERTSQERTLQEPTLQEPTLQRAVMCETIQKFAPVNVAVVFSIDLGRVYCFTDFDPVPVQSITYHKWYRRGSLVSVKQLTLNPPRWSSFSSIQLRELDKGPWQVEVIDENGKLLRTLLFSITD